MWKEDIIPGLLEGIWRWTQLMDSRNGVASCKRGDRRLLDKVFKLKPIKRKVKSYFDSSKYLFKLSKANVFSTLQQQ